MESARPQVVQATYKTVQPAAAKNDIMRQNTDKETLELREFLKNY